MRILLKILLSPVLLVLTVVTAVCRFLCVCSTAILSLLSLLMFIVAVIPLLRGEYSIGLQRLLCAYLISPYGIPLLANWLVDKLDDLKRAILAI